MGILYWYHQLFPPASRFSFDDVPDLSGKVAIVTGANTGVGKETAKVLLEHNARVYVASRDRERGEAAIADLAAQTGKEAQFLHLDLADLRSVKAAAEDFAKRETQLHMLFNNAGVMMPDPKESSAQGYDLQFGTNVLGHFYLTKNLLPILLATANACPRGTVRVISLSSMAYIFAPSGGIDFTSLKGPNRRRRNNFSLYAQSKFGNILFANELARRYGDQGIVSVSIHPGSIKTEMTRHLSWIENLLIRPIQYPASYGALSSLYAGTTDEGANLNGKYLVPWARVDEPSRATKDPKLGSDLWVWMEEQVENIE